MIINKFILHIFHCLVYLETVCLCVSSILSSKSLHGREFLGLWSRGQKSSTMKYDRIPDDEQKQTPLNFFPSSSPFLPQTRHYFYQEKFASQPPPAKKKDIPRWKKKERKKEEVLSTVPRSPLQLCTWPRRDREHVPRAFISSCPRNNTTKTIPFFNVPISPLLERNTDVCDRFVEFGWLPSREEKWFDEILKKIISV